MELTEDQIDKIDKEIRRFRRGLVTRMEASQEIQLILAGYRQPKDAR